MNESSIPSIMTANTYFWQPGSSASSRRSNEQRHTQEVHNFLTGNGFEMIADGTYRRGEIKVFFSYSESCKNVYKSLTITRNGKRSNITALKKALGIG